MALSWEFTNTPAGRVLKSIQMRGRASIKDVAADLGVTPSAVRLHLMQLEARGAIEAEKVREGVGRPYFVYSVTPEAHNLFHKGDGDLARLVLQEVEQSQGPDALQDVLDRVGDRLVALYQNQVAGPELEPRIEAWASILERRGVVAEIDRIESGYRLRTYGCPYQHVFTENRAVCEMERRVMARLLQSDVTLVRCLLDGQKGCQFVLVESVAPPASEQGHGDKE